MSNWRVTSAEVTSEGLEWREVDVERVNIHHEFEWKTLKGVLTPDSCHIWLPDGTLLEGFVRVTLDNTLMYMGQCSKMSEE